MAVAGALATAAGLDFGIQWAGWAVASLLQTEKFYDLFGSSTFVILAVVSLLRNGQLAHRQMLVSLMVCIWGFRLGLFLFSRVLRAGKDSRFEKVRDNPLWFLIFWTIQGVWVLLVILPVLLLNAGPGGPPLQWTDLLGVSVWLLGFGVEAVADLQKLRFSQDPKNKGRWIDTGLWSYSRHPNYLGEIVLWWGVFLVCVPGLEGWQKLAGVISPTFTMYLLSRVSGVPMLERAGDKKWGKDPAYQAYKRRTPSLLF